MQQHYLVLRISLSLNPEKRRLGRNKGSELEHQLQLHKTKFPFSTPMVWSMEYYLNQAVNTGSTTGQILGVDGGMVMG